ncbi:TPM domain-containing protein [Flavobacteriaceae bacterium 14752]|uniref:TPM domain-containing protein n=1 Tax=Mesohalobacter salilacus TaxID=2491711 RepID=UPI000F645019|nr:TPM domain-containing protein [Flavobacteriaceae bacterium 14752]
MSKLTDYISKDDEVEIVDAIKAGEKQTSGEIRLHIEMKCPVADAYDRALGVFEELNMHKTDLANGILLYVALEDHKLVLCGDKGINEKVGQGFWESTVEIITSHFKKNQYKEGLVKGIAEVGQKLKQYFPYQSDDANELKDDISKG